MVLWFILVTERQSFRIGGCSVELKTKMVDIKVNIANPKDGKTYKKEISADNAKPFFGLKIGDKLKGELLDMSGYEFVITGGSDRCGFPMRRDLPGSARKKVLISGGVGLRAKRKGMRIRKSVAGNTVSDQTAQLNIKVTKVGKEPLGAPKEEKSNEEAKSEENKE